jgi:hypothetical protein
MLLLVCEDAPQLGSYLAMAMKGLCSLLTFVKFVVCVEEKLGPKLGGPSW